MKDELCTMKYKKEKTTSTSIFHIPRLRQGSGGQAYSMFHRGISLVEVVIGTALILLALTGMVSAYSFYLKAGLKNTDHLKSVFLLQEGVEAVTLLRDDTWSNLSSLATGTPYYLSWNGTKWVGTTTATLIDTVFTRTVTLDSVYRKTAGQDIVASSSPDAKALDANARKLTVKVSWGTAGAMQSKQVVTFLTNLFE